MRQDDARKTHVVEPERYILVTGSLITGLNFYGPFATRSAAVSWAEANLKPAALDFSSIYPMRLVRDA